MKSTIAFALLFSLWTISVAEDVTIYNRLNDSNAGPGTELKPSAVSQFPWEFSYHSDDWVFMSIYWKNKSPSVTAMTVTYSTELGTFVAENDTVRHGPRKGDEYYYVNSDAFPKTTEIEIVLNLYSSNISCSSLLVAKGREVAHIPNETPMKGFQYYDFLPKYGGMLVVDLINKCDENAEQQPSQNNVLIYVIPSVIGMCVIILVIYLLWDKKYCHWNSQPVENMELNTYSTANDVVYADLGFVHGDSQPPRRDEESTYAEIIGVLKPADGNVKNE